MAYPIFNDLKKMISDIEEKGTPYTEIELSSSNEHQTILQIIKPLHYIKTEIHKEANQNTFVIKGEAQLRTYNNVQNREVMLNKLKKKSFINIPKGTKHMIENIIEDEWLFLLTFYSPKLHFMENPEDSYFSVNRFPEIRDDEIFSINFK